MAPDAALAAPRNDVAAAVAFAGCVLAGSLLGWASLHVNRERSCAVMDTPYFDICPAPPATPAQQIDTLRARIARNPGDANAYTDLVLLDRGPQRAAHIELALQLSRNDPQLLLQRAALGYDVGRWADSAQPLVTLAEFHHNDVAIRALAQIVAIGQGAVLEPYLTPGSQWLPSVLTQMRSAGAPFSTALPLVIQGYKAGVLDEATVRQYVHDLKSAGAWADAFGLWVALNGKQLPVLFNGGFDDPFQSDGFDWEVPLAGPQRRAGAIAERRGAESRGGTLDVQFTGRPISLPIARQYLFLAPGRYRLHGEHMGRQFRTEQGLSWVVNCGRSRVGASEPLLDTAGLWRGFEFEFDVPPGCGLVASLQLETTSSAEAVLGARGRVAFDAFTLERKGP